MATYVLTDPRTGKPRYVGSTKLTLAQRLAGHLVSPVSVDVWTWIIDLKRVRLTPLIEWVDRSDNPNGERDAILTFRQEGADLLNRNVPAWIRPERLLPL